MRGLARPEEAAHHRVVGEGLADALRAHVVQHLLLGHLAAPELDEEVLRVASRALHKLDTHLRTHLSESNAPTGNPRGGAVHRVIEHARDVPHRLPVGPRRLRRSSAH